MRSLFLQKKKLMKTRTYPLILSLLVQIACTDSATVTPVVAPDLLTVTAFAETEPVPDNDDAADDPYIMVTPTGKTIIAGTNKRRGVELYNLQGQRLASIDSGRVNNVDGFYDTKTQTFRVAGSNRTNTQVDVYHVTTAPDDIQLTLTFDVPLKEPYGLCVSPNFIYVGDKDGKVQSWGWDGSGPVSTYLFESQTEGCVVDTQNNHLYVGEEMTGIWRVDLSGDAAPTLFAPIDDSLLVGDVEGLDIYSADDRRVLVASSQGDSTYIAYDLATAELLAKFAIVSGGSEPGTGSVDGTQDTDGIAITSATIDGHPKGLLVVQDGFNIDGDGSAANQNFKIVDWRVVESLFRVEESMQ
jgi:3-phytase